LNFDDGSQRVRMVTTRPDGKPFALRLASGPAPSDQWQRWMTMGRDWHNLKPWRETPDTVVIHSGGVSDRKRPYPPMGDYFIIDKRTWLPLEWEYRADTSTSPRVEATLRAEYDVSLPDDTTRLKLPEGARLVDTLSPAASANVPTENVQRARGLTLQVVPLAMDTDGTVLVRSSCWLGTLKLGVWDGTPVSYSVETDHMRFGADGTQDTPYHADDGSRYIDLRTSLSSVALPNGDQLKLLAPLAPRPKGAPLPRSLKLELLVWVSIRDEAHQVSWGGDSFLLRQPFTWTLPLPTHPSPLRLSQYAPGPGPRGLPLAAAIASDRALQYDIMGDRGRAVFWTRQALGAVKPESNEAQDFRLALAGRYDRSGNRQRAEAVYREIIAVRQQHPETRNYYAWQAQVALRTPTAVRRRR
jgi:hypothetical protein